MKSNWYVAQTGNHQRIIISEDKGENVAVVYSPENAEIIASAPAMYNLLNKVNEARKKQDREFNVDEWYREVRNVLSEVNK